MKNLNGKVIALTGAGSGIGRCLAIQLAQHGSHLSLSDVDEAGLKETKELLSQDIVVSTHPSPRDAREGDRPDDQFTSMLDDADVSNST